MIIDKYHAKMFTDSRYTTLPNGKLLGDRLSRFYATQRKLPYAPVLGHERLIKGLCNNYPTVEERQYLIDAGLIAPKTEVKDSVMLRLPEEGTIMFANEPIADIVGAFGLTQLQEIYFEHAFDLPMTVAHNAMEIVRSADGAKVVDFSLRRDGSEERANEVTRYSYIGGFNATSSLTGAVKNEIDWVGTCAHYFQQAFVGFPDWQVLAFQAQLDANPEGTVLLLDTVSVEKGMTDAWKALDTEERRKAFKGFRIDSGNASEEALKVLRFFDGLGVTDLSVTLTGDLNARTVRYHKGMLRTRFPNVEVTFGVGTKLIAETEKVAGVIYKLSEIDGIGTMKISGKKSTLPGHLQVFRVKDEYGFYVKDIIGLHGEDLGEGLLHPVSIQAFSLQEPKSANFLRGKVLLERSKFKNIDNYLVEESEGLKKLKKETFKILTS